MWQGWWSHGVPRILLAGFGLYGWHGGNRFRLQPDCPKTVVRGIHPSGDVSLLHNIVLQCVLRALTLLRALRVLLLALLGSHGLRRGAPENTDTPTLLL